MSWLEVCRGQRAPARVRGKSPKNFWSDILSSTSVKFDISSSLQLLQFDLCLVSAI